MSVCMLRRMFLAGRVLILRLELPISDAFPAINQFCYHFAGPFRALTAVSHLGQESTKGHLFAQLL